MLSSYVANLNPYISASQSIALSHISMGDGQFDLRTLRYRHERRPAIPRSQDEITMNPDGYTYLDELCTGVSYSKRSNQRSMHLVQSPVKIRDLR